MRASLALAGDLRNFAVESCRGKWMERCAFVNESVLHSVVFLPAFCPIWICSWNLKKLSRFQNCAGVEYSFGGIGGMGLASLWNTHPSTDCADAERCKWFANVRHAMSCVVWKEAYTVCCWLHSWPCIAEAFALLMRRTTPMASAFQGRSKGQNWKKTCLKIVESR